MIDVSEAHDRELVQRLRRGDEDAFRGLFGRYAPTAKALALRVVRQSHLAEEIVQEAFMAVWRNPGRLRRRAGLRAVVADGHGPSPRRRPGAPRGGATAAAPRTRSPRRWRSKLDHADDVVEAIGLPGGAADRARGARRAARGAATRSSTLMYFDGTVADPDRGGHRPAARHREVPHPPRHAPHACRPRRGGS